ncbi:MAG TPA: hypothetical protein VF240_17125 [Pyrinomonadaceae bacterium]
MQDKQGKKSSPHKPIKKTSLSHMELAAIDLTITALQAAGHKINDRIAKDDNPREQWATAWADAHHPLTELTERDREIIARIKELAGQLSSRTSLKELLNARGKIVQGG